jgi:hypothetical protein
MDTPDLGTLIAILLPIMLLQWGLAIFALVDLIKRDDAQIRHLPKWAWAAIILLIGFIGAIAYLVAGREEA